MFAYSPGGVKTIFEARARNIDSRTCRRRQLLSHGSAFAGSIGAPTVFRHGFSHSLGHYRTSSGASKVPNRVYGKQSRADDAHKLDKILCNIILKLHKIYSTFTYKMVFLVDFYMNSF